MTTVSRVSLSSQIQEEDAVSTIPLFIYYDAIDKELPSTARSVLGVTGHDKLNCAPNSLRGSSYRYL